MTKLPKYCSKCGKTLISNQVISEYDVHDGEPTEFKVTLHCPDYRGFFGLTNRHFKIVEEIVGETAKDFTLMPL